MSVTLSKSKENDDYNSLVVSYTHCCKTKQQNPLTLRWNNIGFIPNIRVDIPVKMCKEHKSFFIRLDEPPLMFIYSWPNVKPTSFIFSVYCPTFWPPSLQKFVES